MDQIYPDELPFFIKKIGTRKRIDRLYDLRIVTNPHLKKSDQETLINELATDPDKPLRAAKLDKAAFNMLRGRILSNPNTKFDVK